MPGENSEPAKSRPVAVPTEASRRTAAWTLAAIAGLSIGIRIALGAIVPAPFVFLDELGYEQMARSLARSGHFVLYGKGGLAYSPLYPVLLSPIYALTSSASAAYEAAKAVNAVLMTLSVFPAYGIARSVLARRRSLVVAGLAAIAPLMAYSSLELSENAAYPLCLVAVWALLRSLRRPTVRNDVVLLVAIGLACTARLQLVALVPAALTALLLVALLEPAPGRPRRQVVVRALLDHRLLVAVVALGVVGALARTIVNGGSLPLAGRYSVVGHARPSALHVIRVIVDHVAGLDLAVGVIPFACALLLVYVLARVGFPGEGLLFGAVALALTVWLLIEVGLDAAAFDTGKVRLPNGQIRGDDPRFHERYLIYVVPFFLVALVAAIQLRRVVPRRVHVAIALGSAALPAVIPYHSYINDALVADSPALQFLADVHRKHLVAISHATVTAVVLAAVLSAVYLLAFMDRHRPLALVVVVGVLIVLSAAYVGRIRSAGHGSLTLNLSSPTGEWVDAAGAHDVALVSGKGVTRVALLETAFFNLSIRRLYSVCWSAFEPDFGEEPLTVGSNGRLGDASGPLRARYAVVPTRLHVPGRVLARDRRGRLELVEPTNELLKVAPATATAAALGCA